MKFSLEHYTYNGNNTGKTTSEGFYPQGGLGLFVSVCCPVSSLSYNESHERMIPNHNYLYDKYSLVLFDVIRAATDFSMR